MPAESVQVDAWLYGLLSGDAALAALVSTGIYPDEAPEGAAYPFVLFSAVFKADYLAQGGDRAVVFPEYRVYGVAQADNYEAVQPIADRIDALLHGATGSSGSLLIFKCLRQSEWRQMGTFEGKRFRQLGGVYSLDARST